MILILFLYFGGRRSPEKKQDPSFHKDQLMNSVLKGCLATPKTNISSNPFEISLFYYYYVYINRAIVETFKTLPLHSDVTNRQYILTVISAESHVVLICVCFLSLNVAILSFRGLPTDRYMWSDASGLHECTKANTKPPSPQWTWVGKHTHSGRFPVLICNLLCDNYSSCYSCLLTISLKNTTIFS